MASSVTFGWRLLDRRRSPGRHYERLENSRSASLMNRPFLGWSRWRNRVRHDYREPLLLVKKRLAYSKEQARTMETTRILFIPLAGGLVDTENFGM